MKQSGTILLLLILFWRVGVLPMVHRHSEITGKQEQTKIRVACNLCDIIHQAFLMNDETETLSVPLTLIIDFSASKIHSLKKGTFSIPKNKGPPTLA